MSLEGIQYWLIYGALLISEWNAVYNITKKTVKINQSRKLLAVYREKQSEIIKIIPEEDLRSEIALQDRYGIFVAENRKERLLIFRDEISFIHRKYLFNGARFKENVMVNGDKIFLLRYNLVDLWWESGKVVLWILYYIVAIICTFILSA